MNRNINLIGTAGISLSREIDHAGAVLFIGEGSPIKIKERDLFKLEHNPMDFDPNEFYIEFDSGLILTTNPILMSEIQVNMEVLERESKDFKKRLDIENKQEDFFQRLKRPNKRDIYKKR